MYDIDNHQLKRHILKLTLKHKYRSTLHTNIPLKANLHTYVHTLFAYLLNNLHQCFAVNKLLQGQHSNIVKGILVYL